MPTHNFRPLDGRIVELRIESGALAGNLLGDPATRTVAVYLPPGYDDATKRYPLLVDLAAFTSSGLKRLAWQAFGESIPQRVERLIREGAMPPAIVAFPDGFTSMGGNQYVDSPVFGRWEGFLLDEMLPALERELRVEPGPAHRAVFGKSSGGFGALVQAFEHGDRWGAVACHSGDVGFDLLYRGAFPDLLDVLARHEGSVEAFFAHLRETDRIAGGEMHALLLLAMAASYDPDPSAPFGVRLPVDPHTCVLDPERWARWIAYDPLTWAADQTRLARVRMLKALYIDCGARDPYHLHYGARALSRRLAQAGVPHRYDEFDGTHSGIDHRLDVSLPFLVRAIA